MPVKPKHVSADSAQPNSDSATDERTDGPLTAGVDYITRLGWHVGVTYASDVKRPKGGPNQVTQDAEELAKWIADEPGCGLFVNLRLSGLVDLDLEVRRNGDGHEHRYEADLAKLETKLGKLPDTLAFRSPQGGRHQLYAADPALIAGIAGDSHLLPHVELRVGTVGNDCALTLPPTAGRMWMTPEDHPIGPLPASYYERRRQTGVKGNGHGRAHESLGEFVPEGQRHKVLVSELGAMRSAGAPESHLVAYARTYAAELVDQPAARDRRFTEKEAVYNAQNIAKRYPAGQSIHVVPVPVLAYDAVPEWPVPMANDAFHGTTGRIVEKLAPLTEADPHALLIHLLVMVGNAAGRDPHVRVGSTSHAPNLFAVFVGKTSSGRKGTARDEIGPILERADPEWLDREIKGLGSGEVVIHSVRDPVRVPGDDGEPSKTVDVGVADKRLMIVETEYARVLKVAQREGSILSMVIRDSYDGGRLQNATKHSPERATEHHISLIGHITPHELQRALTATEQSNGYANRCMYALTRRSGKFSRPSVIDHDKLLGDEIAEVKQALRWAKTAVEPLDFDDDAGEVWDDAYDRVLTREWSNPILDALLARAAPHALRLALVYAIFDRSHVIRAEHVRAALAVWRYCEESVRIIWRDQSGDPLLDRLRELLRDAGVVGLTRDEIYNRTGRGHRFGRRELDAALRTLEGNALARVEHEETDGRPRERWFVSSPIDGPDA